MLKNFTMALTGLALSSSLMFTATPTVAQSYTPITTEAAFHTLATNKKLWFGKDHILIRKHGALRGNFGGNARRGAWEWRNGYWCRTLTTHSKNTDCQLWEFDGSQYRVTRNKGTGKTFIYTQK